jgi:hypothetical protein
MIIFLVIFMLFFGCNNIKELPNNSVEIDNQNDCELEITCPISEDPYCKFYATYKDGKCTCMEACRG